MKTYLKIAKSVNDLRRFIKEIIDYSEYTIREVPLTSQDSWGIIDGILSHKSKGFFQVTGLEEQGDSQIQQLILYQPQSALTGLIIHKLEDDIFVLLQARVEPGNTGIIQYGPTIQSTPANYLKLHGGKATSYISYFTGFEDGANLITHSMQHDLGKRYFQKSKTHHYIEVDSLIDTDENMIWASLRDISSLCHEDNLVNADLRSLLSVFNWDSLTNKQFNNPADVDSIFLPSVRSKKYKLTKLEKLRNWKLDQIGISPLGSEKDYVRMFEFCCRNREVSKWTQPLYCVHGRGLVQLVVKEENNDYYFLVSIAEECGISTNYAFYPTYFAYPGEDQNAIVGCHILSEMIQCDEGGRFYQNDSLYQLLKPTNNFNKNNTQIWVSIAQLKGLLSASNICSFQLRCISSMILPILNPSLA
ncbi:NDP-hexose 2,3-dehydratase family protein [Algoriphagus persicinus]|uniref:NDP-hexose 2,3-dehydratase family protein n=1 Tax=Algoriphagus persicinus TaxID=3108754 RepID=UPI002B3D6341|nr:NDP-hexose 2,3-dehydratase family protein [Algoriphagus sp. E1-3-M2]MEB2786437.1 NDP-hexose 2,3-dehydratase family protein [Algoriphagus sp. E1-3-M2]